jgi:hypothetical protein
MNSTNNTAVPADNVDSTTVTTGSTAIITDVTFNQTGAASASTSI